MAKGKSNGNPKGRRRRLEDTVSITRGFRVHPEMPRELLEEAIRLAERNWLEENKRTINSYN